MLTLIRSVIGYIGLELSSDISEQGILNRNKNYQNNGIIRPIYYYWVVLISYISMTSLWPMNMPHRDLDNTVIRTDIWPITLR